MPQPKNLTIDKMERLRLRKLQKFELLAVKNGFSRIAGIDEAGRGPLAGPVVAAACIIPKGITFPGVNDSKKLTALQRRKLFEQITTHPEVEFGVGIVSHMVIDQINIYQATIQAMLEAVEKLPRSPDCLLVDGLQLPHPTIRVEKIIQGDQKSHSIAAASIIAKETRDRLMEEEHKKWPEYGFERHKGYSTEEHLAALIKHGPCPIHRRSFAPVRGPKKPDPDLFDEAGF